MSSRRLAISSLLCDDDQQANHTSSSSQSRPISPQDPQIVPETVLLAPHLRNHPQRSSSGSVEPPVPFRDTNEPLRDREHVDPLSRRRASPHEASRRRPHPEPETELSRSHFLSPDHREHHTDPHHFHTRRAHPSDSVSPSLRPNSGHVEPEIELSRAHFFSPDARHNTADSLHFHSRRPVEQVHPSQSRPSSSRSSDSHHGFAYQHAHQTHSVTSPMLSPASQFSHLPPQQNSFAGMSGQQRSAHSPVYKSPGLSPILHRPSSHTLSTSHNQQQSQSRHSSGGHSRSQSNPSPPDNRSHVPFQSHSLPSAPITPQSHTFGLEALVQAATQERKRIVVGGREEQEVLGPPPVDEPHRRHHAIERYPPVPPPHHRPPDRSIPTEDTFPRPQRSPIQEFNHRTAGSPPHAKHNLLHQNQPETLLAHRHRPVERERDRRILDGGPVFLSPVDEPLHHPGVSSSPRLPPLPTLSPPQSRLSLEQEQHKRIWEQQQLHLQRQQRQHHESLLLQEQRQQEQRHQQRNQDRQRMLAYSEGLPSPEQQIMHPNRSPVQSNVPQNHHITPAQLYSQMHAAPPPLRPSGRKSDPGQIRTVSSPVDNLAALQLRSPHQYSMSSIPSILSSDQADDSQGRASKRRRYSDTLPLISMGPEEPDPHQREQHRIQRDRERMLSGDLGFGRGAGNVIGIPAAPVPVSMAMPVRRPGSGSEHGSDHKHGRKDVVMGETPAHVHRDRKETADGGDPHARARRDSMEGERHKMLSPVGRRSPPGSRAGRAIAAKKSEEGEVAGLGVKAEVKDPVLAVLPVVALEKVKEEVVPLAEKEKGKERKRPRPPPSEDIRMEDPVATPDKPIQRPLPLTNLTQEEDAHEWLLEHYADPSPVTEAEPPRPRPSVAEVAPSSPVPTRGSRTPSVPPRRISKSPVSKKRTPTPATMPEAALILEQELEEVVDQMEPSKADPDTEMDVDVDADAVDAVVAELFAETLEEEPTPRSQVDMEVDVDEALLSLLDDPDPPQPHRHASAGSASASAEAKAKHQPTKPTALRLQSVSSSRPDSPMASTSSAASPSFVSPNIRASSVRPTPERGSMPPPATVDAAKGSKTKGDRAGSVAAPATAARKKPGPKPKGKAATTANAPAKPRAKPGPKPKAKNAEGTIVSPAPTGKGTKAGTPTARQSATASAAASRSRSTSVMPGSSVGPDGEAKAEKQEEEEDSDAANDDDKLYCVCKVKYDGDDDKTMIACDRCDEWYHTQCVKMPDLEVDLVDQFVCPLCIEKNPGLVTTYKQRCLFGLEHPDPSSPKACHKPARGAFSKYCSDDCGVKNMRKRIDGWTKKGGKKEQLWESVKNAEKREGVVFYIDEVDGDGCKKQGVKKLVPVKPKKNKIQREVERLNSLLDDVVQLREELKKGMETIVWRERLLELAMERAEQIGLCGWDQRLCFGDEEWAEFGEGVLDTYNESGDADGMDVDGQGEWWCPGDSQCERHAGWQGVRQKDVNKEKEKKEEALTKLTTKEREIRKRIEDIVDPHSGNCNDLPSKAPLKPSNAKLTNGHTKGKTNGDNAKKGKKRKAPS